MTTISSRAFNQDVSGAKRAADQGPVVITDRGVPAYVLLTHDAYGKLAAPKRNMLELLAYPGVENIEFDPQPIGNELFKPVDFS